MWQDDNQGYGVKMNQTGTSFTGRTVFSVKDLTGKTTGSVNGSREVRYGTDYGFGISDSFSGRVDPDLSRISGKLVLTFGGLSFDFNLSLVRQP